MTRRTLSASSSLPRPSASLSNKKDRSRSARKSQSGEGRADIASSAGAFNAKGAKQGAQPRATSSSSAATRRSRNLGGFDPTLAGSKGKKLQLPARYDEGAAYEGLVGGDENGQGQASGLEQGPEKVESGSDEEESDEAPEETSNLNSRRVVEERRAAEEEEEKGRRAARSRAAKARQSAVLSSKAKTKALSSSEATLGPERPGASATSTSISDSVSADDLDDGSSVPASSSKPPTRLDPRFFESVFGQAPGVESQRSHRSEGVTAEELAERLRERREAKRREKESKKREGGVVRSRDGTRMKRLKDGRTVVRSADTVPGAKFAGGSEDARMDDKSELAEEEERLAPRTTYAQSGENRPTPRARAFVKRSLQLRTVEQAKRKALKEAMRNKMAGGAPRPKRTTDDPLGMQDPAFMPGGEHYKGEKKLTGKRAQRGKAPVPKKDHAVGRNTCESLLHVTWS